ncbi:hypothetical protein KEK01_09805, partial [Enterococcus faecium]|nr:hypothetical protein [Enterococcus faecium]
QQNNVIGMLLIMQARPRQTNTSMLIGAWFDLVFFTALRRENNGLQRSRKKCIATGWGKRKCGQLNPLCHQTAF